MLLSYHGPTRVLPIAAHDVCLTYSSSSWLHASRFSANFFHSKFLAWANFWMLSSHRAAGRPTARDPRKIGAQNNIREDQRISFLRTTCPAHRHFLRFCSCTQSGILAFFMAAEATSVVRIIQSIHDFSSALSSSSSSSPPPSSAPPPCHCPA